MRKIDFLRIFWSEQKSAQVQLLQSIPPKYPWQGVVLFYSHSVLDLHSHPPLEIQKETGNGVDKHLQGGKIWHRRRLIRRSWLLLRYLLVRNVFFRSFQKISNQTLSPFNVLPQEVQHIFRYLFNILEIFSKMSKFVM